MSTPDDDATTDNYFPAETKWGGSMQKNVHYFTVNNYPLNTRSVWSHWQLTWVMREIRRVKHSVTLILTFLWKIKQFEVRSDANEAEVSTQTSDVCLDDDNYRWLIRRSGKTFNWSITESPIIWSIITPRSTTVSSSPSSYLLLLTSIHDYFYIKTDLNQNHIRSIDYHWPGW